VQRVVYHSNKHHSGCHHSNRRTNQMKLEHATMQCVLSLRTGLLSFNACYHFQPLQLHLKFLHLIVTAAINCLYLAASLYQMLLLTVSETRRRMTMHLWRKKVTICPHLGRWCHLAASLLRSKHWTTTWMWMTLVTNNMVSGVIQYWLSSVVNSVLYLQ